jgi:thymidylate synthase ThyX
MSAPMPDLSTADIFSADEARVLAPYFTNTDKPVFALRHLPETVKGALFARYSRSARSLRRLFLDEFLDEVASAGPPWPAAAGSQRADKLYARVLGEYGDDSVAQLGSAHLACEGASNVLTKVLEWGRLMAYLEQSTRYVPLTDRPDGRWRYHIPAELDAAPSVREMFVGTTDAAFETYARWIPALQAHFRARYPQAPEDSERVYRSVIRAKTLDTLRGLLPSATQSNVGLFGTGQAYEALLLRMFGHPLAEVRAYADMMLSELRQVIPAFLMRVDQPDRGGRWIEYLAETRRAFQRAAGPIVAGVDEEARSEVMLTDFDPEGETKVVAAALYGASTLPDDQLLAIARRLSAEERTALLRAYTGDRANRRHKPGRAFERTSYRFDVLSDYGAFRDLQRHRLLTLDWQRLSTRHGYTQPAAIEEVGALADWREIMDRSAALHDMLVDHGLHEIAPYGVVMAYRVRFYMEMNAREAMHIIELRTAPQGHPAYRRVCQLMHRAIAETAGHRAIADAMQFADHTAVELERLQQERRMEEKRHQS